MAATDEMVRIALATRPHAACLVPEKREERTTEGGLDIVGGRDHLAPRIRALAEAGIRVSLFVEPEPAVMDAARRSARPWSSCTPAATARQLSRATRRAPRTSWPHPARGRSTGPASAWRSMPATG